MLNWNTFSALRSSLETESPVHDAELPEMRDLPMTCQLCRNPCYQGKSFVLQVKSRWATAQPAFRWDVRHLDEELLDCESTEGKEGDESLDSLHGPVA